MGKMNKNAKNDTYVEMDGDYVTFYCDRLLDTLTIPSDYEKVIKLSSYIIPTSNMLGKIMPNGCVQSLSLSDIEEVIGSTHRSTDEFMRRMKKLGVIRRQTIVTKIKSQTKQRKRYVYYINPYFMNIESRIGLDAFFLFEDFLRDDFLREEIEMIYEARGWVYNENVPPAISTTITEYQD